MSSTTAGSTPSEPIITSSPLTELYEVHFPPSTIFALTSTMLQHDTPNMFSTAFLSGSRFRETSERSITIPDKSPDLFTFIHDYLRGYTIFPLEESAIPKRWLPLQKAYENLKRDAAYYGLLQLERECNKWLKQVIHNARQAVLKLDFAPFSTNFQNPPAGQLHPLSAEMILECHLADFSLLRKRFLKLGGKTLTYGPIPWKQIFEQIRSATDRDGIIQMDGSSLVEVAAMFIKPPRAQDEFVDHRKVEFARIHISREITQLILDGVRPGGMNGYVTIRFHVTDITTRIIFESQKNSFSNFQQQKKEGPVATAQVVLNDKIQKDAYVSLQQIAITESDMPVVLGRDIPMERESKTVLEVDGTQIEWNTLCQWAKYTEDTSALFASPASSKVPDIAVCEKFFGTGRVGQDQQKSPAIASIFGSIVFFIGRSKIDSRVVCPQFVNIRGVSESTWERKRPIWEGEQDRERIPPPKRMRTKHEIEGDNVDGKQEGSVISTEDGNQSVE